MFIPIDLRCSKNCFFFQWVKLIQTLITDPRLKIRNCKGQPHQDISVTTTSICQGSRSLQMRKQKECKSHWWRLKLGKAVFWSWQSYCTHELCGDLQKACTRSRQPYSSMDGKEMHKAPSMTEAVLAVGAGGERVILWGFVVTGRFSTCQWTASCSHISTHY